MNKINDKKIAVIGFSCRFPNSPDADTFWNNLLCGTDCISVTPSERTEQNINRYGRFEGYMEFDPAYFGISEAEAAMMDPQQRWLLELCTEALEHSGTRNDAKEKIGIFAGSEDFIYVWNNVAAAANDSYLHKAYLDGSLASRTAYLLNLTGPSVTLKASCATSLYCIHYACEELLRGSCTTAIAAGVNLHDFQDGYHPAEGAMSRQGEVRPFDANADGFIPGNGIGVIVLKRLEEAERDGNQIYAVICGSGVSNDGRQKLGFTAPSVSGESRAIEQAFRNAGIAPDSVEYVETHGTATDLGDAVEITALSKTMQTKNRKSPLYIGSVKSNIGHLNAAAGCASFLKTVLMLYHCTFVPTLHFAEANPKLHLKESNICVCTKTQPWDNEIRRAGVSAFGIGGNNCHVLLESYKQKSQTSSGKLHIFPVSARSTASLSIQQTRIAERISHCSADDAAYTLQCLRRMQPVRTAVVASTSEEAAEKMTKNTHFISCGEDALAEQVFLFAGTSEIRWQDICALYHWNPDLRVHFQTCFAIIEELTGIVPGSYLERKQIPPLLQNLLIFCLEYAVGSLYMKLGVMPDIVCGYSAGEYMAAYFAQVLTLHDVFRINIARIKALQKLPVSHMMTILECEENIEPYLCGSLEISAYNAKNRIMVSGTQEDVAQLSETLQKRGIMHVILKTERAGHFSGIRPAAEAVRGILEQTAWKRPQIRFLSSCTGVLCEEDTICNAEYWVRQMCEPVRFQSVLEHLFTLDAPRIIAFGANAQLSRFYNQSVPTGTLPAVCILPEYPKDPVERILTGIADAWTIGCDLDYSVLWKGHRGIAALPGSVFENHICRWERPASSGQMVEDTRKPAAVVDGLSGEMYELTHFFVTRGETVVIQKCEQTKGMPSVSELFPELQKTELQLHALHPECRTIEEYDGLADAYDHLCLSASVDLMKTFSVLPEAGTTVTLQTLRERASVTEPYYEMFRLMLLFLRKYGYIRTGQLEQPDEAVTILRSPDEVPSTAAAVEQYAQRLPAFRPFMELLLRCSESYPGVLTGKCSGKAVIYPNGAYHLLDDVYSRTPVTTKIGLYAEILAQWLAQLAARKQGTLKILEVGAGTGIVTWLAMKALRASSVQYWFTDIGRSFLETARSRAEADGFTNMEFHQLDVTKPFGAQGVPEHYFDVVISCNVIQAVSDMDLAVQNMQQALCRNGILALLQTVTGSRISEMIYGLCPEWWNYRQDEKRKNAPVLGISQWEELLQRNQYQSVSILAGNQENRTDAAIIVGQVDDRNAYPLGDEALCNLCRLQQSGTLRLVLTDSYTKEALRAAVPAGYECCLPSGLATEHEKQDRYAFCRNAIDRSLVQILHEVTGVFVTDLSETLYGIAVDSLSALIICTKIADKFEMPFGISKLLEFSCIRELSDYICTYKTENTHFEEEF